MKTMTLVLSLLLAGFTLNVCADQLDEGLKTRPAGVFVKVDPATDTVSVYKADVIDPVVRSGEITGLSDDEKARLGEEEEARLAHPENLIARLHGEVDELDQDGSRPACWYGGWGSGWGWNGWGGYSLGYNSYWYDPWAYPGSFSYSGYSYPYQYGWGGYSSYYPSYGWGGYGSYYPSYGWYW